MVAPRAALAVAFLALAIPAAAQKFHAYVGTAGPRSVLLAWGTTIGQGNTIGRGSRSYGKAVVKVGARSAETAERNYTEVGGLEPDTDYPYEISINGKKIAEGRVRTWPEKADRLAFFVIGDFGTGSGSQYRIAEAMWNEFERRGGSDNPVRFVIATGDIIYADLTLGTYARASGDDDSHWERKFFRPYSRLLARIPFYPTPGNHDGNASENRGDLAVYLDNFFFQDGKPHRWYSFNYGGLAEFFALDSTDNSEEGRRAPVYLSDGEESKWLRDHLPESKALWRIPYFHHPPFNAGPRHPPYLESLRHWVDLFEKSGTKVVFSGHEHNFQFSAANAGTRGIRWVISGAGGELRAANVLARLSAAGMEGWAPQRHFLAVEIYQKTMKITPLSYEEVVVRGPGGRVVKMPLEITLP